jgi:hypothetical protein
MLKWVKQFGRTEYVGLLEGELMRLRAENRALTNSLLGTAGFPPVDFPQEALKPPTLSRVRKRSWPQMQARREADAARNTQTDRDERVYGPVSHS